MKRPQSLTAKIKICDQEIGLYVNELEKENLKLHKKIAKLHVQIVSYQNEITALKKAQPKVKVVFQRPDKNKT